MKSERNKANSISEVSSDLRGVLDTVLLEELSLDKEARHQGLSVVLGGSPQREYVYRS